MPGLPAFLQRDPDVGAQAQPSWSLLLGDHWHGSTGSSYQQADIKMHPLASVEQVVNQQALEVWDET